MDNWDGVIVLHLVNLEPFSQVHHRYHKLKVCTKTVQSMGELDKNESIQGH